MADALDVLDALAEQPDAGVSELVRHTGLLKNKVFRLLLSLGERGYVDQDLESRKYRLGIEVLGLSLARSRQDAALAGALRPALAAAVARCNETALLGIVRNGRPQVVDFLETTRNVRATLTGDEGTSACRSCLERIHLAFGAQDAGVNEGGGQFGGSADLQQVRRSGYAVEEGLPGTDTRAVAVPVLDDQNRLVAGLCILGPADRLSEPRLATEIIPAAVAAAAEASRRVRARAELAPSGP